MADVFDYKEFSEYVKKFGKTEEEFQDWLKMFLLQQAQRVVAETKKRQRAVGAIDTGAMINSWYIGNQEIVLKATKTKSQKSGKAMKVIDPKQSTKADIKVIGDYLQVTIGNPMEYASFIEFGTKSYEGKLLLTLSVDKIQKALPNRFKAEFAKFLKDKGVG